MTETPEAPVQDPATEPDQPAVPEPPLEPGPTEPAPDEGDNDGEE